jgi:hypothetical protein
MRFGDSKVISIECKGEDSKLDSRDVTRIRKILKDNTSVGFNSINYDLPIISYALMGKSCSQIKQLSDYIIETKDTAGWMTMKHKEIESFELGRHIDISNVAPGVGVSLKLYGARMACDTLQDLPIDPAERLTTDEMEVIKKYCTNDLVITRDLALKLEDSLKLRKKMGAKYKLDLMSKSDAQIAERVIRAEVGHVGDYIQPVSVRYTAPAYIKFENDVLTDLLAKVSSLDYKVGDESGKLYLPDELKEPVTIGDRQYTMGLGGLHSKEQCQHVARPIGGELKEVDVSSYYPNLILNMQVKPVRLGSKFLDVYNRQVDDRMIAKNAGNVSDSGSLKIVVNGAFGKLGSKWSALYDPESLLAVTLTGQLSLLMLIESLDNRGIAVVSANTDGVVCSVQDWQVEHCQLICDEWQKTTNLDLDETDYTALYSRDVSNYLAIKPDGTHKGKGIFAPPGILKNPQGDICVDAVIKYITHGTPIEKTIKDEHDIRKFIFVRTVRGGAEWRGGYFGKVVRWVYVEGGSEITYVKNGNKVPKSDSSYPVMSLTDTSTVHDLPGKHKIDYARYINESFDILESIGYNGGNRGA